MKSLGRIALSKKQRGVLKGVAFGVVAACVIVVMGVWFNPFAFDDSLGATERLMIAVQWMILPTLFLIISVGRLAKHRFFTPEDIDGGGLSHGTEQASILQSLLQNTLEQCVIALVVYLVWAATMPASWLSVVPLAAIAFAVGRVMFFVGYTHGAPSRAIGFTLAFYPSLVMLCCIMVTLVWQQFGG